MGKFVIHPENVESRFPLIPRYVVTRNDLCLGCGRCAIRCIYGVHSRSMADYRKMAEPDSTKCKRCHTCIQDCPRRALRLVQNPEYARMGDELFGPGALSVMMREAECGKNPVSGGGYGGAFTGPGFDSFWTDMSEIVRPTRDGIHAREYISTAVEIGRKPRDVNFLKFDDLGNPLTNIPPSVEINIPIIFNMPNLPLKSQQIELSICQTAAELRTLAIVDRERMNHALEPYSSYLIESFNPDRVPWGELTEIAKTRTIVELHHTSQISELPGSLKKINPDLIVFVRIEEPEDVETQVREIYQSGADVIHIRSRHSLAELVRKAHKALISEAVRNELTLIASGGITEAACVPKTIILGADTVAIDIPLVVAMECTLCGECIQGAPCPRKIHETPPEWGMKRIKNLMSSWHNQMLEMLGAMGMREVSRLRGEVGRAIFFEELEKEWIGDITGASHS